MARTEMISMPRRPRAVPLLAMVLIAGWIAVAGGEIAAADWPTWRGDALRSGVASERLPEGLRLQWVREFRKLEPAWPDEPRMQFDAAYEPIVGGDLLFVASPLADRVSAFDAATGEHRWDFFADGPVRFAPTLWRDRLFFGSDDGHLYCVNATDGSLRWRFRAGNSDRFVLGNSRLISTWPVRGAPVVADDTVYFAAGIWPFMGVFVYALAADTGSVIWANDGQGSEFTSHPPSGAPAFGSIAPQGYLAVSGDSLLIPNGRATPAVFDRDTGAMRFFHHEENSKWGDFSVSATDTLYFNSGRAYLLETGTPPGHIAEAPVHTTEVVYGVDDGKIVAYSTAGPRIEACHEGRGSNPTRLTLPPLWESEMTTGRIHALADDLLLCAEGGRISAVRLQATEPRLTEVWSDQLPDEIASMIVADGRLFVSTLAGRVLCYGAAEVEPRHYALEPTVEPRSDALAAPVAEMLERTAAREGYALCIGAQSGEMIDELVRQSDLHVIGVDPDAEAVNRLRRRYDRMGLYGERVALLVADPATLRLPPYLASLTVSEDRSALAGGSEVAERLFHSMRPYGGAAAFVLTTDEHETFMAQIEAAGLEGVEAERAGDLTLLRRSGPLPAAGSWTHRYGDPANTLVSSDSIVQTPLGLLWFGGSTNIDTLPRQGHGSPEQVVGGRLFIEGPGMIRAQDVYTGRVLWERELPGFGGVSSDADSRAGAAALGSSFSSAPDGVYVVFDGRCLRLDPATGETTSQFTLPGADGDDPPHGWSFVSVYRDLLIAGSSPVLLGDGSPTGGAADLDASSSARIIVLDRHSGEVLWSRDSTMAFRHDTICIADERVFCIDRLPDAVVARMARRGLQPPMPAQLIALDARTGSELWSTSENVFGTWLTSSVEHGLLLQAGGRSGEILAGQSGDRMIAYHVEDGSVVWDREEKYDGPPLLHGETILTQGDAFSLLDGLRQMRRHQLTGVEVPWQWERNYGCSTAIASQSLLTFRSGAAGFYDLVGDSGTGNLGGFKSGCTANLIVADGVLNAPDYTRPCVCSYQNQTSLALVRDPDVELWTWTGLEVGEDRVLRVGLNLGAPGDRMADNGTLWLEYPVVGGPSPDLQVRVEPEEPRWFRRHAASVHAAELGWVAASGAEGLRSITVRLAGDADPPRPYSVTLHFIEPGGYDPGERVFDVALQGEVVLRNLDIGREAGGPLRASSRTFRGVMIGAQLTVELVAAPGSAPPVLCGIEAVAE